MSEEANATAVHGDGLTVLRRGSPAAPVVVAVGPTLEPALAATADLDATVAYLSTRAAVRRSRPARAGAAAPTSCSSSPTSRARRPPRWLPPSPTGPHRLLSLGVANVELRRYGTGADHRAAHGLDAAGIRASFTGFLDRPSTAPV